MLRVQRDQRSEIARARVGAHRRLLLVERNLYIMAPTLSVHARKKATTTQKYVYMCARLHICMYVYVPS